MSDRLDTASEASGIEVQISESLRHTGPVPYFGPGRSLGSLVHSATQCDILMMKVNSLERQAAVRPAFRKLAAKLHPDVAGMVRHGVMVQGISRAFRYSSFPSN